MDAKHPQPTFQSGAVIRKMGVATARPSVSVLQTPWRTNVLAVGRFGGEGVAAWASTARQTHPTYGRALRLLWKIIFALTSLAA